MTTLKERVELLAALSRRGQVREKSERLTELIRLLPEAQHEYEKAKALVAAEETLLGEREDILLPTAEGKNDEARKAALIVAKQGDKDWQQLMNMVNTARARVLDASLAFDRLKREWAVLHVQVHVFTATLGFLAGGVDDKVYPHGG